jgi:hypothetical protein
LSQNRLDLRQTDLLDFQLLLANPCKRKTEKFYKKHYSLQYQKQKKIISIVTCKNANTGTYNVLCSVNNCLPIKEATKKV